MKEFFRKFHAALVAAGITRTDIDCAIGNDNIVKRLAADAIKILRGPANDTDPKIVPAPLPLLDLEIDLGADPRLVAGEKHRYHCSERKKWKFDPNQLGLYLPPAVGGSCALGREIWKELYQTHKKLLPNANILDFLFAHQDHIPKSWDEKCVYAFGTIVGVRSPGPGIGSHNIVRGFQKVRGIWEKTDERLDIPWRPIDHILIFQPSQ